MFLVSPPVSGFPVARAQTGGQTLTYGTLHRRRGNGRSGRTSRGPANTAIPEIQSPSRFRGDPGCRCLTSTSRLTAGQLPTVNWSILRSHRFLVLAVAGLFIAGTYFHGFQTPERKVYDLVSKALPAGTV